jgi:hypothetical protein
MSVPVNDGILEVTGWLKDMKCKFDELGVSEWILCGLCDFLKIINGLVECDDQVTKIIG